MESAKVASYLGFCRRAGKLALGVNAAAAVRGRVYLIVADEAASPGTRKEIARLADRFACPLVWVNGLETLVHKDACKVAAVREQHLAEAIVRECADGAAE